MKLAIPKTDQGLVVALVAAVALTLAGSAWAVREPDEDEDEIPFVEAQILFQLDDTDGDLGFHAHRVEQPPGLWLRRTGGLWRRARCLLARKSNTGSWSAKPRATRPRARAVSSRPGRRFRLEPGRRGRAGMIFTDHAVDVRVRSRTVPFRFEPLCILLIGERRGPDDSARRLHVMPRQAAPFL